MFRFLAVALIVLAFEGQGPVNNMTKTLSSSNTLLFEIYRDGSSTLPPPAVTYTRISDVSGTVRSGFDGGSGPFYKLYAFFPLAQLAGWHDFTSIVLKGRVISITGTNSGVVNVANVDLMQPDGSDYDLFSTEGAVAGRFDLDPDPSGTIIEAELNDPMFSQELPQLLQDALDQDLTYFGVFLAQSSMLVEWDGPFSMVITGTSPSGPSKMTIVCLRSAM